MLLLSFCRWEHWRRQRTPPKQSHSAGCLKRILQGEVQIHLTTCPSCPVNWDICTFWEHIRAPGPQGTPKTHQKQSDLELQWGPTSLLPGSSSWKHTGLQSPVRPVCGIGACVFQGSPSTVIAGGSKCEPTRERWPRRQTNSQQSI